jgi:tyrosine phenol-lyase
MTLTNNTIGGQPVSIDNLKAVRYITNKYGLPLIIDSSRIAENTYFIKSCKSGYEDFTYRQIAQEIFSLADVIVMSLKKDGLVNTGGFLCVRGKYLADKCQEILIITEGFTTYGGLAGRDLNAIAAGLKEVFEEDYLRYRVRSVEYLCEELKNKGIPVMYPPGGHAVYIDAAALYPHIPVNQYPAQALVCELYIGGGIRASEIGSVMFGSYDTENNLIPATNELVRLAIPRRVYTQSHIDYVIEVFDYILENKDKVRGYEIFMQTRYLRHFTAKFKKV